ncbi:MAG: hypothetical protein KGH57_00385 [Candidatus Micrarchaeota archaeon]|nr:hypothetical protein [Candidatus Micrarchaeota archaeon]
MSRGIVIYCVQRGIHGEVEKRHGNDEIIQISTAGANVKPYLDSLVELARKEKPKWIEIEGHTRCAAMGHVDLVIRGGADAGSKRIAKELIFPLRTAPAWKSREELEQVTNPQLQAGLVRKALEQADLKVEVRIGEVIDLDKLDVPAKDHSELFLLIAKPSKAPTTELVSRAGLDDKATYVLRVPRFESALADAELLVRTLDVHNVIFLVTSAQEKERVLEDEALFRANFPEIKAKLAEIKL